MKFNPTPAQLVLLAICFASIIVSNIFAPGAYGAITSLVSVVTTYLLNSPLKPVEDEKKEAPVLSIVRNPENDE